MVGLGYMVWLENYLKVQNSNKIIAKSHHKPTNSPYLSFKGWEVSLSKTEMYAIKSNHLKE